MTDDPIRKTALEGIDRAAQADDLLKPEGDLCAACGKPIPSDWCRPIDGKTGEQWHPVCYPADTQPTEERVWGLINRLSHSVALLKQGKDAFSNNNAQVFKTDMDDAVYLLATLFAEYKDYREAADAEAREVDRLQAENKALRERCGEHQAQRGRMRSREMAAYDNGWKQGKEDAIPATHVAVPREPFEALMEYFKRCDFDDLDCGRGIEEYAKAMLAAYEQDAGTSFKDVNSVDATEMRDILAAAEQEKE